MIRVMLIDDEEAALDLLEILLGQIGNVEIVGRYLNPIQALEDFKKITVDAVFLDIQMPGMKGTQAARHIRSMFPEMPIVFTTAYAEFAVEAFEIESTDYLLKPFTTGRLQSTLTRINKHLQEPANRPEANIGSIPLVQCLGGFQIILPGEPKEIVWKTKKERELCAFLIHHEGKRVNAPVIIEALWPGYDLVKAKTYLYTCLSYLRRSLAEHEVPIHISKGNQGFTAELNEMTVDASAFENLLIQILSEESLSERNYDQMNRMYTGDYMEACDFGWASARQSEIRSQYVHALRRWHMYFRSQGKLSLAADSLQRVMALMPDSEVDGRALIRVQLELGNRSEAHRVCLQLEQAVRVQLGTELEDETMLLVQQMLKDRSAAFNET
ncbi:two-component system LytT family response regulator [Paenibacillus sp. 4624]|uniref:Response regulator n=2 Tax=Paenibacillus amylolyticus TaxID=1451 RepID=A0A5M9WTT3_PAEAM|nr:response regulator [Paenibacillus amylolyticus]